MLLHPNPIFALILMTEETVAMTPAGWVFMSCAWIAVGTLAFFCFRRILGGDSD